MKDQTTWNLLIAGFGVVITLIGILMARRGKRRDELQAEKAGSWGRMIGEAQYLAEQLAKERAGRDSDETTWEGRWTRQMERCRKITDEAATALAHLMSRLPAVDDEAEQAIRDIAAHQSSDHT